MASATAPSLHQPSAAAATTTAETMDLQDLGLIDRAFGDFADLYSDVLRVSVAATPEQIQLAYFERRSELFGILADLGNDTSQTSEDVVDAQRTTTEQRLDAVVLAVRVLADPPQRAQYDAQRQQRLLNRRRAYRGQLDGMQPLPKSASPMEAPPAESSPAAAAASSGAASPTRASTATPTSKSRSPKATKAVNSARRRSRHKSASKALNTSHTSHTTSTTSGSTNPNDVSLDHSATTAATASATMALQSIGDATFDANPHRTPSRTTRASSTVSPAASTPRSPAGSPIIRVTENRPSSTPKSPATKPHDPSLSTNSKDTQTTESMTDEEADNEGEGSPRKNKRKSRGFFKNLTKSRNDRGFLGIKSKSKDKSSKEKPSKKRSGTTTYTPDTLPSGEETDTDNDRTVSSTANDTATFDDDGTATVLTAAYEQEDPAGAGSILNCASGARFIRKIGEEVSGAFEDTVVSMDQVFNAFTLTDHDIRAVTKKIDRAKTHFDA